MPHDFTREYGDIAEQQWNIGADVHTTTVTSCIIVAAPVKGEVIAIHLGLFNKDNEQFQAGDADTVKKLLEDHGADMSRVHIFGQVGCWRDARQAPGYAELLRCLNVSDTHIHDDTSEKSYTLTFRSVE